MAKKPVPSGAPSANKGRPAAKSSADDSNSAGDAIDASLAKYRSMRNFSVTAEPAGKAHRTGGSLPFCVQKHAASHLHYDFRLGWEGVLKSWAVAKGPSAVVRDRRLAVQVEDHPIEYGGFEGVIPAGQYGGGTVMLWDEGTWEPQSGHEDVNAGLRDGSLKFILYGHRLQGRWTLVRMGGKAATERKPNWLLIKEHDAMERTEDVPNLTEEATTSVATGRSMEEIATEGDHVWNSRETAGKAKPWFRKAQASSQKSSFAITPRPRKEPAATMRKQKRVEPPRGWQKLPNEEQPEFVRPQLATEVAEAPVGEDWLYELKLDGYRMQARKTGDHVAMLTRSGLDWTNRVPEIAAAVARLPWERLTLDGEVVVLADDGTTDFARLQASFQEGAKNALTFFCFDVLHLDGRSPRALPLRERKALLAEALPTQDEQSLRLCEDLSGDGARILREACALHAEGIIAKRADAPYQSGRGETWLKLKCLHEQEFVVAGFTLSSEGPDRVGSLLLGYFDADGTTLRYAGRTGTGFSQRMRRELRQTLQRLQQPSTSLVALPAAARKGALWVKPKLVAQVRFASWTAENLVRQAAFLGLREDKAAGEVRLETAGPTPKRAVTSDAKSSAKRRAPVEKRVEPDAAATTWERLPLPSIRLTHPGKVLDPESGATKEMLAKYYAAVADRMLPYIAGRPLSLVRCPDGAGKPCFYQKHVNHLLPKGVGSIAVPDKKTGKVEPYITLDSADALTGLAQMGCLEVHPWSSTNHDLERPDRITFDLDPDEALPWSTVADAAEEVRAALKRLKLESFLKTTGGKGLHVVAPIEPRASWDEVKAWTRAFAMAVEERSPKRYLTKMTKAARAGRIYLDYLRNERGATAVAPYSPRARAGLPVSLPLAWEELKTLERPSFLLANFPDWYSRLPVDPWQRFGKVKQSLPSL